MSDIASSYTQTVDRAARGKTSQPYKIEETHWGYIVSASGSLCRSVKVAQAISMVLGAVFLAIVISLWLWPAMTIGVDALLMRYFATVFFGGLAVLFLWYASRGARSEVHIDLSRGEVRDVIRNKTGKVTLLGCYGFDTVEEVAVDAAASGEDCDLSLHYGTSGGCLVVASGTAGALAPLHARISKDVVLTQGKRTRSNMQDPGAAA